LDNIATIFYYFAFRLRPIRNPKAFTSVACNYNANATFTFSVFFTEE